MRKTTISLMIALMFVISALSFANFSEQNQIETLKAETLKLKSDYNCLNQSIPSLLVTAFNQTVIPFDESWTYINNQNCDYPLTGWVIYGYTNGTNYGGILKNPALNITSPFYLADDW